MNRRLILDTNLLVLLIVGGTSLSYIGKHKRLSGFTETDFNLIVSITSKADEIYATPNVLTEVSNLIRQIGEPARSEITKFFGIFIETVIREDYVESKIASRRTEFSRLGLTDCALMEALEHSYTLITDDFDLFQTACHRGYSARNFTHIREAFLN